MTVVETPAFLAAAAHCMTAGEKDELIDFIARHPERGALIPGTGGVRKLRWAVGFKGKRGGVRAIYYFHSYEIPIFLLTAYAKTRKADVTAADKNVIRRLIRELVVNYGKS
ncbi:MAG: addiction module toxin RelE [bacterium]|nr:addiction module toxin RelE [bacterium]